MAKWAERWTKDGQSLFVAPFDKRDEVPISQNVLHKLLKEAGYQLADTAHFIGAERVDPRDQPVPDVTTPGGYDPTGRADGHP